jgi:pimeloyl-ACP methyl ester carboxylesterase
MSAPRAGSTRFALRNNSRIAYDPGTVTPEQSATPAIMLHDLLADRTAFAAQRAALSTTNRIVTPDARGHGASATLANQWYTVAELAQDVIAIMDLEEIEAAHVVGHGLGGATAFELARRFGDRIASMTLIEPALYGVLDNDAEPAAIGYRNEIRASDRAAADAAYKGLVDKSLDTYLLPRWGSGWREVAPKPRVAAVRRHAPALSGLLPALDAYTIAKNDVRQILVPALILVGEDAHPIDRLTANRLSSLLPVARTATIPFAVRANAPLSGSGADALNPLLVDFIADR